MTEYGYKPKVHLAGNSRTGTRCGGGGRGVSKAELKRTARRGDVTCQRCTVLFLYDTTPPRALEKEET